MEKNGVNLVPFSSFFQSNVYGLLLIIPVTSSGKYIVGGGMFQEIHELSDIFHWHHLKNKTKHCCVICFIIWSSRLPDRPIKRKLEWRGRAPIS